MDELLQVWSNTSVIDSIRTLSARICDVSGAYKPRLCTQERIKCLDIKYTSVSVNSMKYLPQLYCTPSLPRGYVLFWLSGAERSGIWLTLPLVRWHISRWDAEPDESQWRRVKIPHWQQRSWSLCSPNVLVRFYRKVLFLFFIQIFAFPWDEISANWVLDFWVLNLRQYSRV